LTPTHYRERTAKRSLHLENLSRNRISGLESTYHVDLKNRILTLNLNSLADSERGAVEEVLNREEKDEQFLIDLVDSSRAVGEMLGRLSLESHFTDGKSRTQKFDLLIEEAGYLRRSLIRGLISIEQMVRVSQSEEVALALLKEQTSKGVIEGDTGIASWDQLLMILEFHPHLVKRVYIDLDETLWMAKGFLATELWYKHWKKRKFKSIQDLKHELEEKFLAVGFIDEVEPELTERIRRLMEKGVQFHGLTARAKARKERTEFTLSLLGLPGMEVEFKGKSCNKGPFLFKTIEAERNGADLSQAPRYVFIDDSVVGAFYKKDRPDLGPAMIKKYNLYPIGYYPPEREYDYQDYYKKSLVELKKGKRELALRYLIESLHFTNPEVITNANAVKRIQGKIIPPKNSQDLLDYYLNVVSLFEHFRNVSDFDELKETFIEVVGIFLEKSEVKKLDPDHVQKLKDAYESFTRGEVFIINEESLPEAPQMKVFIEEPIAEKPAEKTTLKPKTPKQKLPDKSKRLTATRKGKKRVKKPAVSKPKTLTRVPFGTTVRLQDVKRDENPTALVGGSRGEVYQYEVQTDEGNAGVAIKYAKRKPHAQNSNFSTNLFYPITRERQLRHLVQIYEIGEISPDNMEASIGLKLGERELKKTLPYEIQEIILGKDAKTFMTQFARKDRSSKKKDTLLVGVKILEQMVWGLLEYMELGLAGHGDLKLDNSMVHVDEHGDIQVKLVNLGPAGKMFFPIYQDKMRTLPGVAKFFESLPNRFEDLVSLEQVDTKLLNPYIYTTFLKPLPFHEAVKTAIQKGKGYFPKAKKLFENPPEGETPFIKDFYDRNLAGTLNQEEQERLQIGFKGVRNADVMAHKSRRGIFYIANDILGYSRHEEFLTGKTTLKLKGQKEVTRVFFAFATLVSQTLLQIEPFDERSREEARMKLVQIFAAWKEYVEYLGENRLSQLSFEIKGIEEFDLAI